MIKTDMQANVRLYWREHHAGEESHADVAVRSMVELWGAFEQARADNTDECGCCTAAAYELLPGGGQGGLLIGDFVNQETGGVETEARYARIDAMLARAAGEEVR